MPFVEPAETEARRVARGLRRKDIALINQFETDSEMSSRVQEAITAHARRLAIGQSRSRNFFNFGTQHRWALITAALCTLARTMVAESAIGAETRADAGPIEEDG